MDARDRAVEARRKVSQGVNPIEARKTDAGIPNFGNMADSVCEALAEGFVMRKMRERWL